MYIKNSEIRQQYIRRLMDRTPATRNQIAAVSGLSNPYIKELEKDNINNVGREKLVSLSIALDLSLSEIDDLLTTFDRSQLTVSDIPLFLNVAEKCKFSAALHPINDSYMLDLMLLTIDAAQGPHTIVSTRPASCFRHEGHRLYSEKVLVKAHPIYGDLVATINRERRKRFLLNLNDHLTENFVCRHCLEEYIKNCKDEEEKRWRIKHLQNIIGVIHNFENFNFYLTRKCPSFLFVLKSTLNSLKEADKLIITTFPPHRLTTGEAMSLTGFATENKAVVSNFKKELDNMRASVLFEYEKKEKLISYLEFLIRN